MLSVQCSDVIVCSLYIQAGDHETMAVKCGGRGEVRSHGGTVSSLQQQLHCALLGVPSLVQVNTQKTHLILVLATRVNVREEEKICLHLRVVRVAPADEAAVWPVQLGPGTRALVTQGATPTCRYFSCRKIFFSAVYLIDIYRPGGQEQAPSTGSQLAPFSQRHWCWQPWP